MKTRMSKIYILIPQLSNLKFGNENIREKKLTKIRKFWLFINAKTTV